jgi:hypothetical protein
VGLLPGKLLIPLKLLNEYAPKPAAARLLFKVARSGMTDWLLPTVEKIRGPVSVGPAKTLRVRNSALACPPPSRKANAPKTVSPNRCPLLMESSRGHSLGEGAATARRPLAKGTQRKRLSTAEVSCQIKNVHAFM